MVRARRQCQFFKARIFDELALGQSQISVEFEGDGEADSSADSEETEKILTVTISPIGAVMPPIDGFHDMIDLEGWEKESIK